MPTDSIPNGHSSKSSMDQRTVPPLGMSGTQFQRAAFTAIDQIEKYYLTSSSRPVRSCVQPGYLRDLLPHTPPETGENWQTISTDFEEKIMPGISNWQSPKFMAFFPASSTYPGILGELWSAALTVPAFNWMCSPAITELETLVLDWLALALALPEGFMSSSRTGGGGVMMGSASEAILTVMTAARERFIRRQLEREGCSPEEAEEREGEIRAKMVAVASSQAHSSTHKASRIAGTRFRAVQAHAADGFAMTGPALRTKLEEIKAQGLHPYYLTVSLGTTNTAAVDDIAGIVEVMKDYPDVWIHCDAAYAGSALVLPEYQHLSRMLSTFDSFDMNMSKWLLANLDASCLFVQRRCDLTDTFSVTPAYLRDETSDQGLVTDYRDWQIPLSRRFRSLKVWFVFRTWGLEGFREHIRHHLRLGDLFADLIRSRKDLFEMVSPPAFALTVFAVKAVTSNTGKHGDREATNDVTREVFRIIDEQQEFFLTSTVIDGVDAIRVVSANPLAEEKYVRQVFDVLVKTAEQVVHNRIFLASGKCPIV